MTNSPQPEKTFVLTVDTQDIAVRYRPYYIGGHEPYAMLEFTSPHEPRRRIPVSESGYRTFFAPMDEIADAPSIETYACMVAALLASEAGLRTGGRP